MNPEKTGFVEPLKSVFFQYFEQLVDGCCARIDLEFGLHLGKDREKINKDLYKKLLDYLRSMRNDIKCGYLLRIAEQFDQMDRKKACLQAASFDLNTVSFTSDDSVNEQHVANQIIRQCRLKYHEDLIRQNQLLANLLSKSAITPSQNPIAPDNLLNALIQTIKPLKVSSLHRIALYKTFDDNVFSQMGFIYKEVNRQYESLIANAIKNEAIQCKAALGSAPSGSAPQDTRFRQLRDRLDLWRAHRKPSAYCRLDSDCSHYFERFEVKNALQVLGQFQKTGNLRPETVKHPLKRQVIKTLRELDFSDNVKTLTPDDEDVLDLVSLIFTAIAEAPYLSEHFKSLAARLMLPMAAICIDQSGVFTDRNHPARQVVDTFCAAGRFLNPDGAISRSVENWLSELAANLVSQKDSEASAWASALGELTRFVENQEHSSKRREESSIQAMIEQERIEEHRQEALDAIDNAIGNRQLPQTIVEFLKNVWINAMIYYGLLKDRQPELWEKSVQTMNELILSVTLTEDGDGRKLILKCIPDMVKELRKGLNWISYDKELQSRFFKELAVLHVILLNKNEAKKTEVLAKNERPDPAGGCAAPAENPSDSFSDQVRQLKPGDWLVFSSGDKRIWAKLAKRHDNNEILLFVDKHGEKTHQIEIDALAKQFRQGLAEPVEPEHRRLTDVILSELYDLKLPFTIKNNNSIQ